MLYLIEILHQTTTCGKCEDCLRRLYLIEILHQTTTNRRFSDLVDSCILSKFYIKPQPPERYPVEIFVVSYRNSTSNHNGLVSMKKDLAVVSYRNSTSNHNTEEFEKLQGDVVSYRNSTSNHNFVQSLIF